MELWGITDRGKKRKDNQDIFKILKDDENGVAVIVVCDGCGGMRGGNVASSIAAEVFVNHISAFLLTSNDATKIAEKMCEAVSNANKAVYEKSTQFSEYMGMGTTLTALVSTSDGEIIANVGDSRAYHITDSSISQITKDHTVVEDMVARGDLTRDEARCHSRKNLITRVVGTRDNKLPDIFFLSLMQDEYVLLCSDGLTDVVSDEEILSNFQQKHSVKKFCEELVDMALSRGAPDNITAVLFKK